jgi:hypothetical protein
MEAKSDRLKRVMARSVGIDRDQASRRTRASRRRAIKILREFHIFLDHGA